MADKSDRTRESGDGHTKHEINRNREMWHGGVLSSGRHGQADGPGASSSSPRSTKGGAEHNQSSMGAHGGSGSGSGAGSSHPSDAGDAAQPGAGINPPNKHSPANPEKKRFDERKKKSR